MQPRQRQQFHISLVQVQQLQRPTSLFHLRITDDQIPQARRIDVIHVLQVEHDLALPARHKRGDLFPHRRNFTHRDAALQGQNGNSLTLVLSKLQSHRPSLTYIAVVAGSGTVSCEAMAVGRRTIKRLPSPGLLST